MSAAVSARKARTNVSTQHAVEVAQIAAQRVLRDATESTPAWVNEGAVRAVLGDLTDELRPCAGECGARLLRYDAWQSLEKPRRARLRELGVNRISSFGRCWKCTETGKATSHGDRKYRAQKISLELKAQIPEIWKEIQDDGGGAPELGKHLGVTRERARQLVKELGLPRRDRRGAKTQEFLEELEFLAGFQLGVHEISQRFGMTARSLVERIDRLRARGLTTVSFPTYFRYYDVDSESRVSARNQRVHDEEQAA